MDTLTGLILRPELGNDYGDITALNNIAFGQSMEGRLVEALRRNPHFIKGLSLVAVIDGKLVGHILFFPILIKGEGKVFRSLALAPMSVLPEYQGKGIGSALVNLGLEEARADGFDSVIVLGHRDFYPRFGFVPASRFGISPPYEVPDEVFFAMELYPGSLQGVIGMVEYPPEFAEAEA
ncbi:MAG: N-acetyltransferase [Lentimicrobium sp.]|nr:N-acetyltransferase [Lentimicrobium sp.]